MEIKKNWGKLFGVSVLIVFLLTGICMCTYPVFYNGMRASVEKFSPYENEDVLNSIAKSSYVLYKNLYEKQHGEAISYGDLYINTEETKEMLKEAGYYADMITESASGTEVIRTIKRCIDKYFEERFLYNFSEMEKLYDYYMVTADGNCSISNTTTDMETNASLYDFLIEISYDSKGNASVVNVKGINQDVVFKNMTSLIRDKSLTLPKWLNDASGGNWDHYDISTYHPTDCRVIYGVRADNYTSMTNYYNNYGIYVGVENSGLYWIFILFFTMSILVPALFPWKKLCNFELEKEKIFRIPFEALFVIGLVIFSILISANGHEFYSLMNGEAARELSKQYGFGVGGAQWIALFLHGTGLFVLFAVAFYIGLCCTDIRNRGVWGYIKEHSLIYRFFPFVKNKSMKVYHELENYDLSKDARHLIVKVVLINGVILLVISSLWFLGWFVLVIYSVILYFVLKAYVGKIQKRYGILLSKINQISEGDLNVAIPEPLGVFETFKIQLLRIQAGFRNAVEKEVKSERMKAELITNVSHDLKTPLTAIITYIDLLKDENLTPEQRRDYLDTLDRKSMRLKVLIEDLFEVSKANSGSVTMNFRDVDICNLLKQVQFEFADKLSEKNLDVKMNLPEEKIICSLDSQKAYRIYENLLNNIAKYSMTGSRVYINAERQKDEIVVEMKNISATELTVRPEELTERFVRGDASRNTEGSGLGLAIAKSFVELQGGKMLLQIDGDLFKVMTRFPVKQ